MLSRRSLFFVLPLQSFFFVNVATGCFPFTNAAMAKYFFMNVATVKFFLRECCFIEVSSSSMSSRTLSLHSFSSFLLMNEARIKFSLKKSIEYEVGHKHF